MPSDIPGESGFDNDAHRLGKLKLPLKELADAANHALKQFRKAPQAMKAVLGAGVPFREDWVRLNVKQLISKFIVRAYRGNDNRLEEYATRLLSPLPTASADSRRTGSASLMHVFEMILISPEVLYRFEHSNAKNTPYLITGLELATRLSYFLWARPPDAELLKLRPGRQSAQGRGIESAGRTHAQFAQAHCVVGKLCGTMAGI